MVTCVTHTQYRVFIAICGGDVLFTHFKVLVEIMGVQPQNPKKISFTSNFYFGFGFGYFWGFFWVFI